MDRKSSDEFDESRGKLRPESWYDNPEVERKRGPRVSVIVTITVTIAISIPLGLLAFFLGRYTATPSTSNIPVTVLPVQQAPQITPKLDPTLSPPVVNTLNAQLTCQHCEETNVAASIKSYSTDALGYTSFILLFTNHTSSAVNMKVDTIKMIDQSGNSIPLHSNDPYVPVAAGQTIPMSVVLQFIPQQGAVYTFSIVVEEANVFSNFYQSHPLTLSQ